MINVSHSKKYHIRDMWSIVTFAVWSYYTVTVKCQFYECHDDSTITPMDGTLNDRQFTWIGVLQYIHIKKGNPHYFRVPRVVLISRRFALSTAHDASDVPEEYALGNVAFGNYERDEDECRLTVQDLEQGVECEPAALLMPIADVLVHPAYKHFGVKNSIALLKLITFISSAYMLPVCLPFKNFLIDKHGRQTRERIIHVDYVIDAPRDFADEDKVLTRISLLPKELCSIIEKPSRPRRRKANNIELLERHPQGSPEDVSRRDETRVAVAFQQSGILLQNVTFPKRMLCSTGCGFHSGAPSIVHEHTGHWSLVALAIGGPHCPDPLRSRRPPPAAKHIAIYPYVGWITAAITGKAIGAFAKDDPFGFIMARSQSIYDLVGHRWLGHWWMGGIRCFDRGDFAEDMFKFYHEIFSLTPTTDAFVSYHLEISTPVLSKVMCVKVGMPFRYGHPRVYDIDSPVAKVHIPLLRFSQQYEFQVEAWGQNLTETSETVESVNYSQEEDQFAPNPPNEAD